MFKKVLTKLESGKFLSRVEKPDPERFRSLVFFRADTQRCVSGLKNKKKINPAAGCDFVFFIFFTTGGFFLFFWSHPAAGSMMRTEVCIAFSRQPGFQVHPVRLLVALL